MKISFIPAIFGISEPIIYGLPLVFNQYFLFPFLLCPTFSTITALLAFESGFLTANIIDVPFGIPILFNAFTSYGVNGVLVQLFCIIVSAFIWFPFVRLNDTRSEEYEI